ncbi:hypothetical protein VNI00_013455 [Paramarasmius palmivorus]|uniref:DUF6535 domain-containing protein n=1 Tax=Paramarasmius palmivorus TaxID=297713 RepID=A0AAW0C1B9_9AGAR
MGSRDSSSQTRKDENNGAFNGSEYRPKSPPPKSMRTASPTGSRSHSYSERLPHVRMWTEGEPYRFAPKRRGDPWEECLKRVDNYDDEMCRGWKEDIDTLLVFAGLFSATVTAFVIESYHWLTEDPDEASARILAEILQHLIGQNNTAAELTIKATTHVSTSPKTSTFGSEAFAIRVNVSWFLSLILALSTVMLGILCKQWIREHRRDTPSSSPKETLELRQLRFESLERWGVLTLLASLPLILQLALVLFFAGLLDLLWALDYIVASLATALIGLSVFILSITTVLPCYYLLTSPSIVFSDSVYVCPYKSPQAWLYYRIARVMFRPILRSKAHIRFPNWASSDLHIIRNHFPVSTLNPREYLLRGLKWMIATFSDSTVMANHIFHCMQGLQTELVANATGQPGEKSRDVLYYNFFRNSAWDPDTGRFLAELFLRQVNGPLNSQTTSSGGGGDTRSIGDALGSFWNLAIIDFVGDGLLPELQTELLYQIIASVKQYCADGRITLFDMSPILMICRELWKHPSLPIRQSSISILDDLESWLSRASEDIRAELVPSVASALTEIIDKESETDPVSEFVLSGRGPRFVRLLDEWIVAKGIDMDDYSMHDMAMSWGDAKEKILRMSGLSMDYFDSPTEMSDTVEDPGGS